MAEKNNFNFKSVFSIETLAWLFAIIAFLPAGVWLFTELARSQQLRDAIIILTTAILLLAIEYNIRPHKPRYSNISATWLGVGYVLLFISRFFGIWGVFLILAGFSATLISIGLACFDKRRYIYATGGAFFSFTILSFLISIVDLPLRLLAGKLSADILSLLNNSVQIMVQQGVNPQLALRVNDKSYLVATECNGFGIISGCLILSILMSIFRKNISILKRIFIVIISAIFAYLANSLRIVSIILVAPTVGEDNYMLMHETFGYLFFAMALILVWQLSRKI